MTLLWVTYWGVRSGSVQLRMTTAMTLAVVLCFILLPVISVSDDLLAMSQAAQPESEQTWRLASHDAQTGIAFLVAVVASLLLMIAPQVRRMPIELRILRPIAARLARLHHLRPPPASAV